MAVEGVLELTMQCPSLPKTFCDLSLDSSKHLRFNTFNISLKIYLFVQI
jgi:hypothetical protein